MTLPKEQLREGTCELCTTEYPVWFAPNELWNQLGDVWHFLCPTCFTKKLEQLGFKTTAWCVTTEKAVEEAKSDSYMAGLYLSVYNPALKTELSLKKEDS